MNDALQANQRVWNQWTTLHLRSAMYDVAGFKAGKSTLLPIERKLLGDVRAKSLLHLQCHFGLDTLSWARLGAQVTGVDFAPAAIDAARQLATELKLPARFVCSDIDSLPQVLDAQFDIVFTSYGVLCWLPDLQPWARVIRTFLKPGGTFCIVAAHPFTQMFNDDAPREEDLRLTQNYFPGAAIRYETSRSYVPEAASHPPTGPLHEWDHSFADILNSLITAGLRIERLEEYPLAGYRKFPFLTQRPDGLWQSPTGRLPLLFSLLARG